MMPTVTDAVLAVGSSVAASIVAKATVTLALALVSVRLARSNRAAVRHLLLAAAFGVILLLPLASLAVPSVLLEVPHQVPVVVGDSAESLAAPPAPGRPAEPLVSNVWEQGVIPSSRLSASALLWTGWAAGAMLCLLPVLVGLWQVRTLRRTGRPWPNGRSLVKELTADADIHRRIDVLLHEAMPGPVSCGVARPAIVLPADAQGWHADDLNRAIVHELEHVRRGDWAIQCLARIVCACYWFHPLVWIAWRQLALEAERACDDAVLRRGEATAYADQLVVLAERLSAAPTRHVLGMVNRTELATRVAAVLDNRQRRGRAGARWVALACTAAALLVMTMSPLRIVVAAQGVATSQTFSGSLMDPLGRPFPEIRITLVSVTIQQPIDTWSDKTARFTFDRMPAGEYLVRVQGFGSQGQLTIAPGQHLNRDITVVMQGGDEYTTTVSSNDAPTVLSPLPAPLPPPSTQSQTFMSQTELDRCRQVSMFCRVTPPVQIARVQPVYPAKQRDSGVGGSVVVEGRVGTDGLIKDLRALAPADPDFASAALDALRRWQFRPIQFDGVSVDMNIRVTANFAVR